jgi:transposase
MRQLHHAGAALEVDLGGMTLPVIDAGVAREAQVFIACLPFSDLAYAEVTWMRGQDDRLAAHVPAFDPIGGSPKSWFPTTPRPG